MSGADTTGTVGVVVEIFAVVVMDDVVLGSEFVGTDEAAATETAAGLDDVVAALAETALVVGVVAAGDDPEATLESVEVVAATVDAPADLSGDITVTEVCFAPLLSDELVPEPDVLAVEVDATELVDDIGVLVVAGAVEVVLPGVLTEDDAVVAVPAEPSTAVVAPFNEVEVTAAELCAAAGVVLTVDAGFVSEMATFAPLVETERPVRVPVFLTEFVTELEGSPVVVTSMGAAIVVLAVVGEVETVAVLDTVVVDGNEVEAATDVGAVGAVVPLVDVVFAADVLGLVVTVDLGVLSVPVLTPGVVTTVAGGVLALFAVVPLVVPAALEETLGLVDELLAVPVDDVAGLAVLVVEVVAELAVMLAVAPVAAPLFELEPDELAVPLELLALPPELVTALVPDGEEVFSAAPVPVVAVTPVVPEAEAVPDAVVLAEEALLVVPPLVAAVVVVAPPDVLLVVPLLEEPWWDAPEVPLAALVPPPELATVPVPEADPVLPVAVELVVFEVVVVPVVAVELLAVLLDVADVVPP